MNALFRPGAKAQRGLAAEWVCFWLPAAKPLRFGYFEYSFILVILPPTMLFEAPRRLP
ncbi:hypothetical protein [Acidovorax sp.]|uniref:hypothetical protein n=1 Tax=Acidovorax sp. TaxID=1872122 RepID=UPI00391F8079